MNEKTNGAGSNSLSAADRCKLWACAFAIVVAFLALIKNKSGESILSFLAATLLLFSAVPTEKGDNINSTIEKLKMNFNFIDILRLLIITIRNFFQYGDFFVRFLLIIIAIGGTLAVIKDFFELNWLPDYIDVWIKRIGPSLVIVVMILYVGMFVSKRIFNFSSIINDNITVNYEGPFYICCAAACIIIITLFSGLPLEKVLSSHPVHEPQAFKHNDQLIKAYIYLFTIFLMWMFAFGGALLSRFFERSWRGP